MCKAMNGPPELYMVSELYPLYCAESLFVNRSVHDHCVGIGVRGKRTANTRVGIVGGDISTSLSVIAFSQTKQIRSFYLRWCYVIRLNNFCVSCR